MKTAKKLGITLIALIALVLFLYIQNNWIVTSNVEYSNPNLPGGFSGYRIVQVSDLHNKNFGRDNSCLLAKIREAQPDIVVITGDLIDSKKTRLEIALAFAEKAGEIAPVYFVSGNHESNSGIYPQLKDQLIQTGVTVLDDSGVTMENKGDSIALLGLADPAFIQFRYGRDAIFSETLALLKAEHEDKFTILLSHRPEKMSLYAFHGIDLVFAGHAHGGQFRLPLVGGLIAPDQGFFPKYTGGLYVEGSTSMYVSRGLGNSIIPQRLFNRPELVIITLRNQ